jgi:hypothetical protein
VQLLTLKQEQAGAMLSAMKNVATMDGELDMSALERRTLDVFQRVILGTSYDIDELPGRRRRDLGRVLADPALRRDTVRMMVVMAMVDKKVHRRKTVHVFDTAAALGVHDDALSMLDEVSDGEYLSAARIALDHVLREYWIDGDRPGVRDWIEVLLVGSRKLPGDDEVRRRYMRLRNYADGTLGNTLYHHYRDNGFEMPGEPGAVGERLVPHEIYHVLGGYGTDNIGEMQVAAFCGPAKKHAVDALLLAMIGAHLGAKSYLRKAYNVFDPELVFRAMRRGMHMTRDLDANWSWWSNMDAPVDELRRSLGVPGSAAA